MLADVLLITVTEDETRAVFAALKAQTNHSPTKHYRGDKTYYDLGQIGGARVWLARSEQGTAVPGGALVTVLTAISEVQPGAVMLVGVAFGTQPQQQLGDVLVATQIQLYEPQRVRHDPAGQIQIAPRGDRAAVSPKLLDRCRDGALFWPLERAQVRFGLLLSGEKLIEHSATLAHLLALEPEAVGGEMEGGGLYVAATHRKVDWIVIRAIGAWADGQVSANQAQCQTLAARNAAEFTLHVLAQGGLVPAPEQDLPPSAETSDTPPPPEPDAVSAEARAALAQLRDPAQPLAVRQAAGARLGELGGPHLLDPYTGDAPIGGYWCALAIGPFWFGEVRNDGTEQLQQMIQFYSCNIARFPVTNIEYGRFIDAGGYQPHQPWWNTLMRTSLQSSLFDAPRWWNDPTYNQPAQPVVGVCWYEAMAYCAWLTSQGHANGWLPLDALIRLPTWREWQRAARHSDQRCYPWGQAEPEPERANYQATQLERPAPVGCFPAGRANCGALDLAGNVLEWTATSQQQPQQSEPVIATDAADWMIVAGGAFHHGKQMLRCGFRASFDPAMRSFNQGFRIVCSPRTLTQAL